jgi:hypothetical protein
MMENNFEPRLVIVKEVVESRYSNGVRPASWDERRAGVDRIRTSEGEELLLLSAGQQGTPKVGWQVLLTGQESLSQENSQMANCFTWTLYGLGVAHDPEKRASA